jgi:tetratricopeptide (TPR) repeat protein
VWRIRLVVRQAVRVTVVPPTSPHAVGVERPDFFVSYAGPDRPWARWVASVLEANDFRVEIDEWDWPPGCDVVQRMNLALEGADRILALWSPHYFEQASWAGEELSAAMYLRHEDRDRLVPVLVERSSIPPLYRPLLTIDLTGRSEPDAVRELLQRLQARTGRGQTHPFPGGSASLAFHRPVGRFPDLRPPVWRVPGRNPNFAGRDRMLEELHALLTTDERVVLQALHGLGGVGKSQLAIEYAHRFASEYTLVWWLDAEQPELLPAQFTTLAPHLGLPAHLAGPDAVDLVLHALRDRQNWLLIFDNATGPSDLLPYRPSSAAGRVLVTSRTPHWGALGGRLEVDVLNPMESVYLLKRRIPHLTQDVAEALADEMGRLPLALEQAAGYMEMNGTPPDAYLNLLRSAQHDLLGQGYVADHVLMDATWNISLQQLQQDDSAAVQLLEHASLLAPEPLPIPMLWTGSEPGLPLALTRDLSDPVRRDHILGILHRYALARRDGDSIQLHRMVQAAVLRAIPEERRANLEAATQLLLLAAIPRETQRPEGWPVWAALLPHVIYACAPSRSALRVDVVFTLLERAGSYLHRRGEARAARPLLEMSLRLARTDGGIGDQTIAIVLHNLAAVLLDLNDPAETAAAVDLLKEALEITQASLGARSPEMAMVLSKLAMAHMKLSGPGAALPLLERALSIEEAALGPDHPSVGVRLNRLGLCLADLGQADAALPLLMRSLDVSEGSQQQGPWHPECGTVHHNIGHALFRLNDLVGAVWELELAVGIRVDVFGEEHPSAQDSFAYLTNAFGQLLFEADDPEAGFSLLQDPGLFSRMSAALASAIPPEALPFDLSSSEG